MKKKIVVTGGSGRFGKYLRNLKTNYRIFFSIKKGIRYFKFKKNKKISSY